MLRGCSAHGLVHLVLLGQGGARATEVAQLRTRRAQPRQHRQRQRRGRRTAAAASASSSSATAAAATTSAAATAAAAALAQLVAERRHLRGISRQEGAPRAVQQAAQHVGLERGARLGLGLGLGLERGARLGLGLG